MLENKCKAAYDKNNVYKCDCGVQWLDYEVKPPCLDDTITCDIGSTSPGMAGCYTCGKELGIIGGSEFSACPRGFDDVKNKKLPHRKKKLSAVEQPIELDEPVNVTAADILVDMAETFKKRNAIYGDNYKMVSKVIAAFFPDGVPSDLVLTDQWHLFELKIVKLTRFTVSGLTHVDSIHDDAVYSAMIEMILKQQERK